MAGALMNPNAIINKISPGIPLAGATGITIWHLMMYLSGEINTPAYVAGVLVFFIALWIGLNNLFWKKEIYNVENLYSGLLIAGVLALAINIADEAGKLTGILNHINELVFKPYIYFSYLITILYFLITFNLIQKLIFFRSTRNTIRIWRFFCAVSIGLLFVSLFPKFLWHPVFVWGLTLAAAVSAVFLLFQIKWIVFLKSSAKWYTIATLLAINLVHLALIENYLSWQEYNPFEIEGFPNLFVYAIIGLVSVYNLHAFFSLLFNLPLARTADEQLKDIERFREMSSIIKEEIDVEELLSLLLEASIQNTNASGGWMVLCDNGKMSKKIIRKGVDEEIGLKIDEHFSNSGDGSSPSFKVLNLSREKDRKRYDIFPEDFKSTVIFFIFYKNRCIARLYLFKKYERGFDQYMIETVEAYIDQVLIAYENQQLLKEKLANVKIARDLETAREVQARLFPGPLNTQTCVEIYGINKQAIQVGGDFYDYHIFPTGNAAVFFGDVSGKGISAALYMAQLKGIFQTLVRFRLSPENFIKTANNVVSKTFDRQHFVTLSYLYVDCKQKIIMYTRAGLCPLLYYNSQTDQVEFLKDEGMGLGILRGESFHEHIFVYTKPFNNGDFLLLYTDGIVEAKSENEEEFGYQRLKQTVIDYRHLSGEVLINAIFEKVKSFSPEEALDDQTLLILKFK